jgi:hypothetical protein
MEMVPPERFRRPVPADETPPVETAEIPTSTCSSSETVSALSAEAVATVVNDVSTSGAFQGGNLKVE